MVKLATSAPQLSRSKMRAPQARHSQPSAVLRK
jgi:hypothetical protein